MKLATRDNGERDGCLVVVSHDLTLMADAADIEAAEQSDADLILLDNGAGGTGRAFPWHLLQLIKRPYILAGGLNLCNVKKAMAYAPYALDVSSGIESNGRKDAAKMREFMRLVRSQ